MIFTTCDFCEHNVGPYKDIPKPCITCKHFNSAFDNFQLKKNMDPLMAAAWKKRQKESEE